MSLSLDIGDTRLIIEEARQNGVLRNQLAYILATAYWETAKTVKPVREAYYVANSFNAAERWRKRNLRYYPYYGRGYVQLTWRRNYELAGNVFGRRMVEDPDIALETDIATKVLVRGMMNGWFTGKKLDQYVTLQFSDFYNARRVVNGLDKAREIANLAEEYDKLLMEEGYGVDSPPKDKNLDGWLKWLKTLLRM